MDNDGEVARISTPEQFKALGHPMRHRLLLALGQGEATISQLAAALGSNKGNIAHHLKVLTAAGLVSPAGTRRVRGGTERYYRRSARRLEYDDEATTAVAFRAIAAEIAAAEPDPLLVLRSVRLTAEHARRIRETLRTIAELDEDGGSHERYGLIIGLYQPRQLPPDGGTSSPGEPATAEGEVSCTTTTFCAATTGSAPWPATTNGGLTDAAAAQPLGAGHELGGAPPSSRA